MKTRYRHLQAEDRMTLAALRQQGYSLRHIAGVLGRSAATLSRELRRLRQLEEENRKLKQIVADLSLDKAMLQAMVAKKV
jgi:IS30 family transposase